MNSISNLYLNLYKKKLKRLDVGSKSGKNSAFFYIKKLGSTEI